MLRPTLCRPLDLYRDQEVRLCLCTGIVSRSCVCVSYVSRSRDPCPPLYSPGEAGVLVGYKVEILVGLRVTSSSRITCN